MPNETDYVFEDFRLDPSRKLLLRLPGGEAVPLTQKAFEVLLLLVENSGKLVSKDDLMTRVWPDSFVEEANLTQTISVLRRILGESPHQHRFIVTETGQGYRFVAPVKAVDRVDDAPASQPSDQRRGYLLGFVGILTVFLISGSYFFWGRPAEPVSHPSSAQEVKAIAVLPFRNIEAGKDDDLLGIGMADALITKLSYIKSIVVRQTKSVARYADSTPEAIKVGREINVDAVVEGSIQKADGRIRVSVRLFRVSDGTLLWAEHFDERYTDIFALQDSISEKVAKSLSVELNPEERDRLRRRYTENIEAYQLYNKGRFFWNNRSSEDLRKSIAFYEQAIAIDKDYAPAYAGLAENYVLLHLFSQPQEHDYFPKARIAAEKALSLDKDLAEARTALASYKQLYEWDWEGAETEFKQAISANPNYATAHQWYGEFLAFRGRTEDSIAEIERSVELDPLSLSTNTALAFPYMTSGQYDLAIEKLKVALELDEKFPLALYYLGRCYAGKGLYKEAAAEYQKAMAASGGSSFFASSRIYALVKSGQKREAEKAFADITGSEQKGPISRYVLARSHAALGNNEKAFEELDKAFQARDGLLMILRFDQNFDGLLDEPRVQAIIKKMRL